MNFEIKNTNFDGLKIIKRIPIEDERGFFERLFCKDIFNQIMGDKNVIQINHSRTSKKATVRGLHYQIDPFAETKIISCLKGEVWDVAVDLRTYSPTYLKYFSIHLKEENLESIIIPEGFAHGFQTLKEKCELLYLHTVRYEKEYERGINPLDPAIGIQWPLPIIQLSKRDQTHKMIDKKFLGMKNEMS